MKFLIKIEEAIDQLLLTLVEKMKGAVPHSFYAGLNWLKHLPGTLKDKIVAFLPKIKAVISGIVGFFTQYITMIKGHITGLFIYLRSDEFKNKNKLQLLLAPIKAFWLTPVKAFSVLAVTLTFSFSGYFIFKNTEKIIVGTKALRAPASIDIEEDPILEFKKLKYEVLSGKEIFLDVTVLAKSLEERDKLIPHEKEIEEHLLGLHLPVTALPLSHEDTEAIQKEMMSKIVGAKVQAVEIKQVLEGRPKYFMQTEKMISFKDINLQLFLEDTRRNRQVWVDFTVVATNRNIVLFLQDNEIEVRDYINMHVEPVIPQLPIEEEGRQIIKEKIKLELNDYLKKYGVEGKLLEIYVDYIIVS